MLVQAMNNKEISAEIGRDHEIITGSSTLWRQKAEYEKLRRKLKIGKEEEYPVFYEFMTKSKNHWITRITKSRSETRYNGPDDSETTCFTYFYSSIGIRVFLRTESGLISVWNSHLFTRYKERMDLGISLPLDLVKCFFSNNREWNYMIMPGEIDEKKFIGIYKEGFALGNILIEGGDLCWFIHKTFISRNNANLRLTSSSEELIEIMKNNLVKANPEENKELYDDLLKLYQDFGLMEKNEFGKDVESKMKEIVREVQEKNMPETNFWILT